MPKTANLYARIEPELKEEAEAILSELGIPVSGAINLFYRQIVLQRGLPFEIKLPSRQPLNTSDLSREELSEELQQGYDDVLAGRTTPADEVFARLHRKCGI